jgi:hypothetical protein
MGIEPLKLAFPTQVTYNQPSYHIKRINKNHARRETSVIGVQIVPWLVKQPLNSTNRKTHHKPKSKNIGNNSYFCKNMIGNSTKYNPL